MHESKSDAEQLKNELANQWKQLEHWTSSKIWKQMENCKTVTNRKIRNC